MKWHAKSSVEFVPSPKENILKPVNPADLDVSPKVVAMLYLIMLTLVYAERKHQHPKRPQQTTGTIDYPQCKRTIFICVFLDPLCM